MVNHNRNPINNHTCANVTYSVAKLLGNTVLATSEQPIMAKNYSFTLNNPTNQEIQHLDSLFPNQVKYLIYQIERGLNNTEHVQGYAQLTKKSRLARCKEILGNRSHIEISRGTPQENTTYCSKPDGRISGPFIYGEPTVQGQRTDIEEFVAASKRMRETELVEQFPHQYVKYYKCASRIKQLFIQKCDWVKEVTVFYGKSGTGKTRTARDQAGADVFFLSKGDSNQSVWWDGYEGQECVIIDDFYGWLPWSMMLRLLDRYPFQVQGKGTMLEFVSRRIFITSNVHPNHWYMNIPNNDMTPLLRRINLIQELV